MHASLGHTKTASSDDPLSRLCLDKSTNPTCQCTDTNTDTQAHTHIETREKTGKNAVFLTIFRAGCDIHA